MGRVIVKIPMEPYLSRAIIEAMLVRLVDPSKDIIERLIKILAMIVNNNGLFYNKKEIR